MGHGPDVCLDLFFKKPELFPKRLYVLSHLPACSACASDRCAPLPGPGVSDGGRSPGRRCARSRPLSLRFPCAFL